MEEIKLEICNQEQWSLTFNDSATLKDVIDIMNEMKLVVAKDIYDKFKDNKNMYFKGV